MPILIVFASPKQPDHPDLHYVALGISLIIVIIKINNPALMPLTRLFLLLASLVLGGCASTHHNPKDPLEPFNRGVYQFNDAVDKAVIKPAAKGYNAVMPAPGKMMISNFFSNLNDITVAINDLLQFKVVNAISDGGRVVVNSTVGLLGLVDVASAVGLKKHNEDFGQTLGRWGFGSGPYLMIPLLGPSSVRDGVGLYADISADVLQRVKPVDARNQLYATGLVSKRANLLDQEKVLDEAMIDRYSFIRDAYLQRRRSQVYDGDPPREKFDDEEDGAVPDKASYGDSPENAQPAVAGAASVATPVIAASAEPAIPQPPSVHRIWLMQQQSAR